ncbi:hypothetical protein [Cupriavidus basilensis]|uniref:hypothetical protein n=1 Tax=Cupriavidus basilensis TaxID=68895 RepID=UPI00075104A8|nr:hypothetical protein [Cupriavidus basilensis]
MSNENIIGKAEAWRNNADGPYTSSEVVVSITDDGQPRDFIEIGFQLGDRRDQVFLCADAEALLLAVLRVRSKR